MNEGINESRIINEPVLQILLLEPERVFLKRNQSDVDFDFLRFVPVVTLNIVLRPPSPALT